MNNIYYGVDDIVVSLSQYPDYRDFCHTAEKIWAEYSIIKWEYKHMKDCRELIKSRIFSPGGLGNAAENLMFSFLVDGISRATTHQLVRTRIGASFSQESQRLNDVRDNPFRMPETIEDYIKIDPETDVLAIEVLEKTQELYRRLVDSGRVPYQDARYFLPEGTTTHIICTYSYPTLYNLARRRMCKGVQWEINKVVYLMKRAIMDRANEQSIKASPNGMWADVMHDLAEALLPPCIKVQACDEEGKIIRFSGPEVNGCKSNELIFPSCIREDQGDSLFPNSINANHFYKGKVV